MSPIKNDTVQTVVTLDGPTNGGSLLHDGTSTLTAFTTTTTSTSDTMNPNSSNSNDNDDFDDTMQSILDLMYHRVNGGTHTDDASMTHVTNDQIEDAVQKMLQKQPQPQQPAQPPPKAAKLPLVAPSSSSSSSAAAAAAAAFKSTPASQQSPSSTTTTTNETKRQPHVAVYSSSTITNQNSRSTRSSTLKQQKQSQPQLLVLPQQPLVVVPDLEEYDDLPDENDNNRATKIDVKKQSTTSKKLADTNSNTSSATTNVHDNGTEQEEIEIDWSVYEIIPLGKQGGQMMTIFGDGKHPCVNAVRATLYGTRCKIQCTIQDARHVRRQQTVLYRTAKNSIKAEKSTQPGRYKQEWSTELLFRASAGYDPLAYQPKCGFGMDDLYKLHPEELNAYNRWDEMHTAAAAAADEPVDNNDDVDTGDNGNCKNGDDDHDGNAIDENNNNKPTDDTAAVMISGHLQERAAQFDVRTNKMGQDWYMKYANIRQKGSFLPRHNNSGGGRGNRASKNSNANVDAMWDATTRQKRKTGEHTANGGGWTHMSASAVRFLHWIGFDPTSPVLPPPTDDVTAAVAFLAYDFFGRIVEKAIFLRNCQKQLDAGIEINEMASTNYELEVGEQLTEGDIERAMDDPDIKPVPLYSVESKKRSFGPQLYFGPGFEDRLEMEMEEMLWDISNSKNNKHEKLSTEELLIRQQEDDLFAQLATPPTQDGIVALLQASQGSKDNLDALTVSNTPGDKPSKRAKR